MASPIYKRQLQTTGYLADNLVPHGGAGMLNLAKDFRWTLSPSDARTEVPTVQLREYQMDLSVIARMTNFYQDLASDAAQAGVSAIAPALGLSPSRDASSGDSVSIYEQLYPRNPTGWIYVMPYLSNEYQQIQTSPWAEFGNIMDTLNRASGLQTKSEIALWRERGGIGKTMDAGTKIVRGVAQGTLVTADLAQFAYKLGSQFVGVTDKPKIFSGHSSRSITIAFDLFNTISVDDWVKNRDFLFLFVNQNLYNKFDLASGIPPVFYEVKIPGVFYSNVCQVDNIAISNSSAGRKIEYQGRTFVVPDAYQVSITLSELLMPSRALHQAVDYNNSVFPSVVP